MLGSHRAACTTYTAHLPPLPCLHIPSILIWHVIPTSKMTQEAAAPASNDKENCLPALAACSEAGPSRSLYISAPTRSTALGSAKPFLGAGIVGQGDGLRGASVIYYHMVRPRTGSPS